MFTTITRLLPRESVMNPKEIDHEILTVKEISDLLQVHQPTIYKMVRQGKIPSFRVGADWRFRKDLIERWMAEKSMSAGQVRKVIESGVNGRNSTSVNGWLPRI
jgi:excisionase family DNA binding protein